MISEMKFLDRSGIELTLQEKEILRFVRQHGVNPLGIKRHDDSDTIPRNVVRHWATRHGYSHDVVVVTPNGYVHYGDNLSGDPPYSWW